MNAGLTGFDGARLVVSRRKSGLGDCLVSLCSAWAYARSTRRSLVCDWRGSTYLADADRNAFSAFFDTPETLDGVPLLADDRVAQLDLDGAQYPRRRPRWSPRRLWQDGVARVRSDRQGYREQRRRASVRLIRSQEDVAARVVVFEGCLPVLPAPEDVRTFLGALRLTPPLAAAVSAFERDHFAGRPVVGVHLRHGNGGDIQAHAKYWADESEALARCVRTIEETRSDVGSDAAVFLACDAERVETHVRDAIPDLITRSKFFRADGCGELHKGTRYSEVQGAHDALAEMFLLARCAALVRYPPDSYFSFYAGAFVARQISPPPPHSDARCA